jgi:hypothetical protein
MDKAGVLIERLLEQYRNDAGKEQLRATAQLLLYELGEKENEQSSYPLVSVFFPTGGYPDLQRIVEAGAVKPAEAVAVTPEIKQEPQPEVQTAPEVLFDPMVEIPTLALKQQEVNETIAAQHESVNDKLKSIAAYKELGNKLKDGPIKDLRKAIGINDQYLFINDLFRGDQTMYERSIKTINGFNIYAEAELWIKRELKLKLGWNDELDSVKYFDQLIKRRFA